MEWAKVGNLDLKVEVYAEMVVEKPSLSEQRMGFILYIRIT